MALFLVFVTNGMTVAGKRSLDYSWEAVKRQGPVRVGNLAFLKPNNSNLAFFSCFALKKMFGLLALFWLFYRVTRFK